MAEGEISSIFLNWDSLLLALFVLGIGYIGLYFFQYLKKKNIYTLPIYDKLIQSSLIGFISFSFSVSSLKIQITDKQSIYQAIGNLGLFLFFYTLIVALFFVFLIYLFFYIVPTIEVRFRKNNDGFS